MFTDMALLVVLCLSALIFAFQTVYGAPAAEEVTTLPGVNFEVKFKHYSGFLQASDKHHLFYWFTESQGDPTKDPFVLWLTGGPGCSSLDGLLTELGPFYVSNDASTIYENQFAWNKVANVLFLEGPVGVGFAYTTDNNITTNDNITAQDNYLAVVSFLNKFPEFKNRDFYITGESYGGFYIPTLAMWIMNDKTNFPNFKGVAIGNGLLSEELNVNSLFEFMYYHGMIGDQDWDAFNQACCPSQCSASCNFFDNSQLPNGTLCSNMSDTFGNLIFEGLDPYDLYYACYQDGNVLSRKKREAYAKSLRASFAKIQHKQKYYGSQTQVCGETNTTAVYINRPDVRKALHVPDNMSSIVWEDCNDDLNAYYYQTIYDDMFQQFHAMLDAKIRILVYNGDTDMMCNYLGDQWFVRMLGKKVLAPKQAWTYQDEVAGYVTKYDGIDQLTVRGSGHFVPALKPREALQMIANFFWNKDYSTPTNINIVPAPTLPSADTSSTSTTTPDGKTVLTGASTTPATQHTNSIPPTTGVATAVPRAVLVVTGLFTVLCSLL